MSTPTLTVPYITRWSTEATALGQLTRRPSGRGIAYRDEALGDRDKHGVLWARANSAPTVGRPSFGKIHPARQRRAMRRLLCQVCANPADQTPDGVLWLLLDHRDDWPDWPHGMGVTEPPICRPCIDVATQHCPALRRGHIVIRSRQHDISGIQGLQFHPGRTGITPGEQVLLDYTDPAVVWTLAHNLVRLLGDCTIVD
ncbi:hypothetical protein [Actinokineospora terrae]|uniref:Uncharacterized protein n=1 Tax=Actinokineospora terrae TaxID=155974 RepID=A0A1H9W1E8_9PSEU|nr:hypothetical protein [Actinokineospora terrae]SES27333.1 hypothetical protein SAMN04487818_109241 [Actinokineospora terrae]